VVAIPTYWAASSTVHGVASNIDSELLLDGVTIG
jgi:hypothetical protein